MAAARRLDEIPEADSDAFYDYMATSMAAARAAYFSKRNQESESRIGVRT